MIRLIGILTGSALAVTAIFVAFGVPELTGSVTAPVAAPLTEVTPPDVAPEVLEEVQVNLQPRTDPAPPTEPIDEIDEIDFAAADELPIEHEALIDDFEEPVLTPAPAPVPATQPQNWYAFWSPFRSELAADGFVSELQRTTGLDYRVVKLKPGVYEVAFAYSDPVDRQDKLEQISAATGLDMSGG